MCWRASVILMVVLTALHGRAQNPPADPPASRSVDLDVLELGDPDAAVRDRAMRNMMVRADLTDDQIAEALTRAELPETRHRLIRVAEHRFFARQTAGPVPGADQGCLGISLSTPPEANIVRPEQHAMLKNPAFLIGRTIPGFPAHAHLKPGDMITGLNGQPFPDHLSRDAFTMAIKAMAPGTAVTFHVVRDDQKLDVRFRIDSYHRLTIVDPNNNNPAGIGDNMFGQQWRAHLHRLLNGAAPAPPIALEPPAAADEKPDPRDDD